MKRAKKILLILGIAAALVIIGRGFIARVALAAGVKAVTGVRLQIQRVNLGLFRSEVSVRGLKLLNPRGFEPERLLAELPEVTVDYDLGGFFKGRTHLERLSIYLKELVVVRNAKGQLNLDSLTAVRKAKEKKEARTPAETAAKKPSHLRIDLLQLKVDRVVYKDYSRGSEPDVREFNVNLEESYRNITDPAALGALIVTRALVNTTISGLLQLSLDDVEKLASGVLGTAEGAAGRATETLKKFLSVPE